MKRVAKGLALGLVVLGMITGRVRAAVDVELTVTGSAPGIVQPASGPAFTGGTWQVYAQLKGNTSTTLGLAGLQFSITGIGGAQIYDFDQGDGSLGTSIDLPAGTIGSGLPAGFNTSVSTGDDGQNISGYQNTSTYKKGTGASSSLVSLLQGVGLSGGQEGFLSWSLPVLVADGYYSFTQQPDDEFAGFTVQCLPSQVDLLPAVLPAPTTTGVSVQTFHPDTVNGVPEPASVVLLVLGGAMLAQRRRVQRDDQRT